MNDAVVPETSGPLAREAGVSQTTIGKLAAANLLDYVVTSTGVRLFRPGQAEKVRSLIAERQAARGRRGADEAA
jgi:hypothetical protein